MKKSIALLHLALLFSVTGAIAQISLSEELVVVSNERGVNSEELEFSPVFYKDGIVFISTRHESLIYNVKDKNIKGKNIMSIYWAQRNEEGFLGDPQPLADELIFRAHEGPVTFDRTANTIFFTRNESLEKAPDGYKKLQVYAAEKEGESWQNIQKLSFNNVNFNYCHPTISPDEDVLFVSSDVPGGYGGMDLYAVYRVDGKWSQMVNLGDKVNSPGNEVFPYIAADGTLYFSSDGHAGLGNLDLYFTTQNLQTEEWRTPGNLGLPFNSPADDFGLIVDRDNKNGYFSSDRSGGFGGDDIYKFYIETSDDQPIAGTEKSLEGLVISDEEGNPVEGADVSAINFKEISLSASDDQIVKLNPGTDSDNFVLDIDAGSMGDVSQTNSEGRSNISLRRGNYVVKVAKHGYVPEYVVITPETDLDHLGVTLQKAIDCVMLSGNVKRENSKNPVAGAAVKIVDVDSRETVTIYADAAGFYEYCIECNRIYSIYAEKDDVSSAPSIVNTKAVKCNEENSTIDLPIYMGGSAIYAGMTIRLPNIYFNFDDASLRPDAYKDLDEVVTLLKQYQGMKLELASHTDSRGNSEYNQDLSYRRSKSVYDYIVSKGVPGRLLEPIGYGESQIRNRCKNGVTCSESEHQYNRRTEVKILELMEPADGAAPMADVLDNGDYYAAPTSYEDQENAGSEKGGQEATTIDGLPTKANVAEAPVHDAKTLKDEFYKEGTYAVIAGTFANHSNALKRVSMLMEKGYMESNIVRQERNGLYAVFVHTFDTKSEAFSLVKKLDAQQFHSYVLRR